MLNSHQNTIGIVGLGYVGLPLAVEFGRYRQVVGYDINHQRINELASGFDATREVTLEELQQAKWLSFSADEQALQHCSIYIVTVQTPINREKTPDFQPLITATTMLGSLLKPGDIVIYESTVYPGATEEICVPILSSLSGLRFNHDYFVGYSPERVNPGDKKHRVSNIKKITSGSTPQTAHTVDELYKEIIVAGTYLASSIKVAEAAKVIENTQRDLNIALINELSIILNMLDIDTEEVLKAAGTKWNFLPFTPGLVGGHCIGVDPYYLTHKAQSIGYVPDVILSGRRINDAMGKYVVSQLLQSVREKQRTLEGANVLIMGFTFKENCPDCRNTRIVDIVNELNGYGADVDVYDPWIDASCSSQEYGISIIDEIDGKEGAYDAIIVAVKHGVFAEMGCEAIRRLGKEGHILYDLKYLFPAEQVDLRL